MHAKRFRFGLFAFDGATGELRREGTLLRLQGQPALALGCLIANPGQVVTREELCRAIWGGETHVDFERGLNFCVGQIRSALEDDADAPRYVRTIPRRGYQFIAPVEVIAEDSQGTTSATAKAGWSVAALATVPALVLLVLGLSGGYWLRSRAGANGRGKRRAPIVAVLRFDNQTPDPTLARFSDGLTDSLVAQLTTLSNGRYQVIGNAAILRLPREQRDLKAVASAVHADYVVLGQVQSDGAQARILAHLIRLPDQTHVWVARLDHQVLDTLSAEGAAADKIAGEFAPRLIQAAQGITLPSASPAAANR
jgi:DNA-binding winged helix-turn-helix (wHTH) protein/TolB-like protein